MTKFIKAYEANANAKTANALVRYLSKHAMAVCMASDAERAVIERARKEVA